MLTRLTALDGGAILSLVDAKAHLRVRHDDEDALIADLRDAAILHIERISGIALASAEYQWTGAYFPPVIDLPMGPVTALGAVAYFDDAGTAATYTGARLVGGRAFPAFAGVWPSANDYAAVTFTAGETAPADLLAAAKLLLGHLYVNREAGAEKIISEIPMGVDALVQPYRQVLV